MKEDVPVLYPNEQVGKRVGAYSKDHSTAIPKHVVEYHAYVRETMPETANYMVSTSQAQAMSFLAKVIGARRILEIGVYVGLSSLVWAHAVGPEGKVTGLEFNTRFANLAKEAFETYGLKNVELVIGDAVETLAALSPKEPYDIIFIDAQKTGYPQYLDTILSSSQPSSPTRLLRPGGIIIGDNTLRYGLVADDSEDNPWRQLDFGPHRRDFWKSEDVKALRKFNETISKSGRLENWLCPLWDGVNIARLLD